MDSSMTAIRDAVKGHIQRRDLELYAAWRAGYDYFYVVRHNAPGEIPKYAYIPSNSPEHKFREFCAERFDLRREAIGEEAWEKLVEYSP